MKHLVTWLAALLIALGASRSGAEEAAPATVPQHASAPQPAVEVAKPARPSIQQNGLTFVLQRSSRHDNVDTEEYFLENETEDNWSQMLTYQRLELPQPIGTDQYVGWLKTQLEQVGAGARLRTVQMRKEASVFGVQYPKDAKAEEQFVLALVTVPDARRPNELHVIQYTIQSQRVPVEEMELQVKRWQARFQSQASSLSR